MAPYRAAKASEIGPGQRQIVEINGRSVGIFNVDGQFFALRNRCAHQGGPTCEGHVGPPVRARIGTDAKVAEFYDWANVAVACPWHGLEFDIRNGQCLANPAWRVQSYEVIVDADDLIIDDSS